MEWSLYDDEWWEDRNALYCIAAYIVANLGTTNYTPKGYQRHKNHFLIYNTQCSWGLFQYFGYCDWSLFSKKRYQRIHIVVHGLNGKHPWWINCCNNLESKCISEFCYLVSFCLSKLSHANEHYYPNIDVVIVYFMS